MDYERATEEKNRETEQRIYLEGEIRAEFGAIIGESASLKSTLSLASVVAPTDSSVLILGETGTGKELIRDETMNARVRYGCQETFVNCRISSNGL